MLYFNRLSSIALIFLVSLNAVHAQDPEEGEKKHYLYSYFAGNGEDGLHLAYSTDGFEWKALNGGRSFLTPTAGEDKLMRDPSIVRAPDGTYHMVWTVSWGEKGIGYASSKDLIHWSDQRFIPVMAHEVETLNCWAPDLFDEVSRKYLIFWASTIPGRFPETDGQDASGNGPGYNHRIYYTTTEDFETFSKAKLFYDHGFNVIDAAIVKEGDRYVMFLKDETNKPFVPQKNIRVAFAERAEGPYGPPSDPITGDYWAEGPTALKIDGKWLVYFDKYRDGKFGVVTSTDLVTWTDESNRLIMPDGMRHGTAFEVPEATIRLLLELDNE